MHVLTQQCTHLSISVHTCTLMRIHCLPHTKALSQTRPNGQMSMNHTAKPCKTAENPAPTLRKTMGVSVANADDTTMNHVITTDDAEVVAQIVEAMREGGATFGSMELTYEYTDSGNTHHYIEGIHQLFGYISEMATHAEDFENITLKVEQ